MAGEFKRWSIMARRDGREWVEICRCDSKPEQLRSATLFKGYDEAGIMDNYRKLIGDDGKIDSFKLLTEMFGAKIVRVPETFEAASTDERWPDVHDHTSQLTGAEILPDLEDCA